MTISLKNINNDLIALSNQRRTMNGQRLMKTLSANFLLPRYALIATIIAISLVAFSLGGCGQKGGLYLSDTEQGVVTSSAVLDSTSQPQDAAFAGIDDDAYQTERYLEEQQILPEPSDDPNDY